MITAQKIHKETTNACKTLKKEHTPHNFMFHFYLH
jgi:hypothetical protein